MGVSLKIYKVTNCETVHQISDLSQQLESEKHRVVDLYKIYEDLSIVLTNNVQPFELKNNTGLKTIIGNPVNNLSAGDRNVVGFLNYAEICEIHQWILSNNLNTEAGFYNYFNNVSEEVKQSIEDFGMDAGELFHGYFKNLAALYSSSETGEFALVFCAE